MFIVWGLGNLGTPFLLLQTQTYTLYRVIIKGQKITYSKERYGKVSFVKQLALEELFSLAGECAHVYSQAPAIVKIRDVSGKGSLPPTRECVCL